MVVWGFLRRANETQPVIVERYSVLRIPASEERARDLTRHATDAGTRIDPARRDEIHPRFAVALAHEFEVSAVTHLVLTPAISPEPLWAKAHFGKSLIFPCSHLGSIAYQQPLSSPPPLELV